jgi:hypothetical protein
MSAPAVEQSRESLWEAAFETYYDAFFEELTADALMTRWGYVDDVTKSLVALTAVGSAVSGWTLWAQPGYRALWLVLSGVAAVLSIVHSALGIPGRLKMQAESKTRIAGLRTDLETFRYRMRVNPEFDVGPFTEQFIEYRRQYSEHVKLLPNDILRSKSLEKRTQAALNLRLKNEIVES